MTAVLTLRHDGEGSVEGSRVLVCARTGDDGGCLASLCDNCHDVSEGVIYKPVSWHAWKSKFTTSVPCVQEPRWPSIFIECNGSSFLSPHLKNSKTLCSEQ